MKKGSSTSSRISRIFCAAAVICLAALTTHAQPFTSTHSFTNSDRGSHPHSLVWNSVEKTITVDLSALPQGTEVYRAILVPHRAGNAGNYPGSERAYQPLIVEPSDQPSVRLRTVPPRHLNLDCTEAARRALQREDRTLVLNVISFAQLGWGGAEIRLDVTCNQPPVHQIEQVPEVQIFHRDGDTLIYFREVDPPLTNPEPTGAEYRDAYAHMDDEHEVRYRIYRSTVPIDVLSIRQAELVDEIRPLSCWNEEYYGPSRASRWSNEIVPRLPIDDMVSADPGTGIYVRRAQAEETVYYAVSRVVDGEEDLSNWTEGGNWAGPVAEAPGTGMVLQWKEEHPDKFHYEPNPTLYYFVRWECPPYSLVPNSPRNYLVGVPNEQYAVDPRPVDVALHCWGGWLNSGYGWWYEAKNGALLVATNQRPFDWWTATHDNYGTIKPFPPDVEGNDGGMVRTRNPRRIRSFLKDFVAKRWNIDWNHIFVSGNSMGGSGSIMWSIRDGFLFGDNLFSYAIGWVGVYIPSMTPGYKESFEGRYGKESWGCLAAEDPSLTAFEFWNSARFVLEHPELELPYLCFANGKNDSAIGWQQAWTFVQALIETRRAFKFNWGQSGHGQRAILPGESRSDRYIGIDIDKDKSLPAFTHCSLDDNMGNGDPNDGDPEGQINGYLLWQPEDSVDEPGRWEMTVYLISRAPQDSCTVDITPRRCRFFHPAPGTVCHWQNIDLTTQQPIASGSVTADQYRLVTIEQTVVTKGKNRIVITYLVGDIDGDGQVGTIDLMLLADAFGTCEGDENYNPRADFNANGCIDLADLIALVNRWGQEQ